MYLGLCQENTCVFDKHPDIVRGNQVRCFNASMELAPRYAFSSTGVYAGGYIAVQQHVLQSMHVATLRP